MEKVIQVSNLEKKYGTLKAVDGISFNVQKGEIFGLLGENGAGKTTTLEIIEGLRKPSNGKISVLGHDIVEGLFDIKEKIGVQLQSSAYYHFLSLKEILALFGGFYQKCIDPETLLSMVDLNDKSKSLINALSGGQKQRFSIVASLVNDPEIVFLDEPTTGLDPVARRNLWDLISKIKEQGKTIILTTHYMEEAEVLCDRIAIMEKGKIIAMGETHKLIEGTKNPFKVEFISSKLSKTDLSDLGTIGQLTNIAGKEYLFELKLKTQKDLNNAIKIIQNRTPDSLNVSRASLEDLFIELTGKALAKEEHA